MRPEALCDFKRGNQKLYEYGASPLGFQECHYTAAGGESVSIH